MKAGFIPLEYWWFLDFFNMICVCNFNLPDHNYVFIDKKQLDLHYFLFSTQIGCKSE